MRILVRNRDYGFFSTKPVTVQTFYRNILINCNHDGYEEETYVHESIRPDDTVHYLPETHEVCDKCGAWRVKGEDNWNER